MIPDAVEQTFVQVVQSDRERGGRQSQIIDIVVSLSKRTVPSSGDYKIDLFLMRNAARRNETANFTITIGATG